MNLQRLKNRQSSYVTSKYRKEKGQAWNSYALQKGDLLRGGNLSSHNEDYLSSEMNRKMALIVVGEGRGRQIEEIKDENPCSCLLYLHLLVFSCGNLARTES